MNRLRIDLGYKPGGLLLARRNQETSLSGVYGVGEQRLKPPDFVTGTPYSKIHFQIGKLSACVLLSEAWSAQ